MVPSFFHKHFRELQLGSLESLCQELKSTRNHWDLHLSSLKPRFTWCVLYFAPKPEIWERALLPEVGQLIGSINVRIVIGYLCFSAKQSWNRKSTNNQKRHKITEGNKMAEELIKKAVEERFVGPQPFSGVKRKKNEVCEFLKCLEIV